jgi:hypothetical protein
MSATAKVSSTRVSRVCQQCRERDARVRTLCFVCLRSELVQRRARLLADVTPSVPPRLPFEDAPCSAVHVSPGRSGPSRPHGEDVARALPGSPRPRLDARAIDHRRRMLAHLQAAAHSRR